MIGFAAPWMVVLLPLPWLVRRLLPPSRAPLGAALRVPFFGRLDAAARAMPGRRTRPGLAHLVWLLLVLAAAEPYWQGRLEGVPTSGRDLMLVVDVSGSMRAMDFGSENDLLDRLAVVKDIAGEFIERRVGDRLGLILFGAQAHLRAPLTHDRAAVRALLEEAEVGLAGEETAIGDAIGLAVRTMRDRPADSRVIVLLTDGVSNAGAMGPRQAARLAAGEGFRIHVVGMGVDDVDGPNPLGSWRDGSRDFNRGVLEEIAAVSDGSYAHALDRKALQEAWRRLDRLEPSLGPTVREHLATPLYPLPLGAVLALSALLALRLGQPRAAGGA